MILSRLAALCGAVAGIAGVGRNRLDLPGNPRPAVIIQDGMETLLSQPQTVRHSELQLMELAPGLTVFVRAGGSADAGVLMSRYRSAIVAAVLSDAELIAATTPNGRIRYDGCVVLPPDAEAKEYRVELSLVFQYPFKLDDLAA